MEEIKLTEVEKRIYQVLLQSIKQKEKETVAQLAKIANVAPSSIIKLAKKLGYPGWSEMYYTLCSQAADSISLTFDNFDFLTDEDANIYIETLCKLMDDYKKARMLVVSIGDSESAGAYLLKKLWHRGFIAMPLHRGQLEYHEPGVLFAINESGIVLLSQCVEAKQKNFTLVSITSNHKSPLASNSHITVEIKNHKSKLERYNPNFFAARVIIFIELLFAKYDELHT